MFLGSPDSRLVSPITTGAEEDILLAPKTTDGTATPSTLSLVRRDRTLFTDLQPREIIQKHVPVWAFKILSVIFIAFMQSTILFLLAAPVYPILLSAQFRPDVDASDLAFLAWQLSLVTSEWFSDGQQWGKTI